MTGRKYLAVAGLVALVALSGCMGALGGGGISEDRLCQGADYDFSADANATYTVRTNGTYQAVYDVDGREEFRLYRTDGLGGEQPLQISAVKFRAEDGTVYDCEDIEVEVDGDRTVVTLPATEGTFAYTARSPSKQFNTRRFVNGTHEVILPAERSSDLPLFARVQPGGYDRTEVDDRERLRWESPEAERISVQYYMERDLLVLAGIIGVAAVVAAGGLGYYYLRIRRLKQRREEAGLDVDVEDDGDDPPPGLR